MGTLRGPSKAPAPPVSFTGTPVAHIQAEANGNPIRKPCVLLGACGPGPCGLPGLLWPAPLWLPWALVGTCGPRGWLRAGPLWAPWAPVGRALVGPLGAFWAGPLCAPWAPVGRATGRRVNILSTSAIGARELDAVVRKLFNVVPNCSKATTNHQ